MEKALKYKYSPEVAKICELLRAQKKRFRLLRPAKILYSFRTTVKTDDEGSIVLGEARKLQNRERDLYGYDFQICMHEESWNAMNAIQKRRICWHELNHCIVVCHFSGEPKYDKAGRIRISLRKHDIVLKTFLAELRVFGPSSDQKNTIEKIVFNLDIKDIKKKKKKRK